MERGHDAEGGKERRGQDEKGHPSNNLWFEPTGQREPMEAVAEEAE
jgi:hypothetical protein